MPTLLGASPDVPIRDRCCKRVKFVQVDLDEARADAVASQPPLRDVPAERPGGDISVRGSGGEADEPT